MRCMMTRWAISRAADDGGEMSGRARAHADSCADCQAFERRVEWLGRSLDKGRERAPEPAEPRAFPRHLAAAGLVAAGAIAVVLMVGDNNAPAPVTDPVVAKSDDAPPVRRVEPDLTAELDVTSLATDAEQGIRYVLRVSGLPEPR